MRLSDRVGRSRECLKNRSRDPIENSAESNESRKRGRKFLVSSGDAALAFESSEEVLYMVTLPIVAAVKRPVFLACGIDGQARKDILFHQHPPGIGVVTFVGDQSSALASRQTSNQRGRHSNVGHIPSAEQQFERAALSVHQRMDLGCWGAAEHNAELGIMLQIRSALKSRVPLANRLWEMI